MTDIVHRLRNEPPTYGRESVTYKLREEAAAEIERLRTYRDEAGKAWAGLTGSQEEEIAQLREEVRQLASAFRILDTPKNNTIMHDADRQHLAKVRELAAKR